MITSTLFHLSSAIKHLGPFPGQRGSYLPLKRVMESLGTMTNFVIKSRQAFCGLECYALDVLGILPPPLSWIITYYEEPSGSGGSYRTLALRVKTFRTLIVS